MLPTDADLREAARQGFILLPIPCCPDGVSLKGRVLRFDPDMPPSERAHRVAALMGETPAAN
jgi:hypothetical protein